MQNQILNATPALSLHEPSESESAFLSVSQQAALEKLTAMVRLASGQHTYGGFRIRTAPLLAGESGTGKTTIVRRCAEDLSAEGAPYPLLQVSAPGWVIIGGRTSEAGTLAVIRSFVRRNDRGILHLDEIDKALPSGSAAWSDTWCTILTGEMLSVMDGDNRLLGAGWSRDDIDRLSNFVIVGSGCWQRAFQKAEKDGVSHSEAIAEDPVLPPELSRRFSPRLIEVELPTKADFIEALRGVYVDLGLPAREAMLDVVSDAACNSGLGFRFIESHLVDLLIRCPNLQRPRQTPKPKAASRSVSSAAYEGQKQDVFAQLVTLQPAIAHLRVQVRLHHAHFFPVSEDSDPFLGEVSGAMEFDQRCLDLLAGLQLSYATSDKARYELEALLWKNAHKVVGFLTDRLDSDLTWLSSHSLISLFTVCQLRLARMIAAWQHLTSLEASEL